eukprot:TRINITY_DN22325_c0_g1_i1.p1 TRINITY_DN22325_c0_g1~~TRINITY_DN22325_c0_g1_i1.p1  ORF type:complete len:438 (-),score=66.39 TRINITY_DN22325_c0_g1_i1:158-1471(-)
MTVQALNMKEVRDAILEFASDCSKKSLKLPTTLTSDQRKAAHDMAETANLDHVSKGFGDRRYLLITKRDPNSKNVARKMQPYTSSTIPMTDKIRFRTHFHLPMLTLLQGPEFLYQIDLYKDYAHTEKLLKLFLQDQSEYCRINATNATADPFFVHVEKTKAKLVAKLQNTSAWKRFSSDPLTTYTIPQEMENLLAAKSRNENADQRRSIYYSAMAGKYFISIDIKSADFQALAHYDPQLVLSHSTWESLLATETDMEFVKQSKKFRQHVLGKMNSFKLVKIEKYLTCKVLEKLFSRKLVHKKQLAAVLYDEIIIEVADLTTMKTQLTALQEFMDSDQYGNNQNSPSMKVEGFRLKKIHPDMKCYVKEVFASPADIDNGTSTPKFKCCPPRLFAQCFRVYMKQPITDNDLKVWDNGLKKYVLQAVQPHFATHVHSKCS